MTELVDEDGDRIELYFWIHCCRGGYGYCVRMCVCVCVWNETDRELLVHPRRGSEGVEE